ncbi:MAG: bifunctional adenosylcobinamide kinase/adenosylcobinamide-phosphate guanylyltransferase, partial [Pseudomonadota bacterium]|nr:bifunctional adenosylcobinamide kinase/adenosylcobinamide-phosphate guanylyltransferase [Pseudomonadota bacterium]
MKELILGGVRSGKSALAQQRALASGLHLTFIATATAEDEAMAARIRRHRLERTDAWTLIEEPIALADVLRQSAAPDRCLLVDCLTLWLSNL